MEYLCMFKPLLIAIAIILVGQLLAWILFKISDLNQDEDAIIMGWVAIPLILPHVKLSKINSWFKRRSTR